MGRRALASVGALVLAGCGLPAPTAPASPSAPIAPASPIASPTLMLPTMEWWSTGACLGIGLVDATLSGDPADPRIAWLDVNGQGRREVVFPPGFTARFAPSLEVLDGEGHVVARAGDRIDG